MKKIALLLGLLLLSQQAFALDVALQPAFRRDTYNSCLTHAKGVDSKTAQGYCGCAADLAKVKITNEQAMEVGRTGKVTGSTAKTLTQIMGICRAKYHL